MLDTTVTIATAARRVNSVFILLNNRMPLAGIKDTSSSLLERKKKKKKQKTKQKKTGKAMTTAAQTPENKEKCYFSWSPAPNV